MPEQQSARTGVIYAASAYIVWGVVPIFWKLLVGVSAVEIVAHRIVWTFLFVLWILYVWGRLPKLWQALRNRNSLAALFASAVLIAVNWGVFIWAVINELIIATSLGYYITPLVSFVLGVVVLGERLSRIQLIAIGLAGLGVANYTLSLGYLPWVSLVLAVSFGVYGLIRKTVAVESIEGLGVEALLLMPVSLGYAIYLTASQQGAFMHAGAFISFCIVLAGPLTAVPLMLFSAGVRLIPLSTLGFLQYLAPSISLLIAVFLYDEPFTRAHTITFVLIWSALALVSWEALQRERYSAA